MYRFARGLACLYAFCTVYGQTMVNLRTQSQSVDFSSANSTRPFKSGTVFPSICSMGEMFYKSDAPAGANLFGCTASNTWTLEGTGQGMSLPAVTGSQGKVLSTDGTNVTWSGLGGDIAGPIGTATVTQIQGRAVSSAAPQLGQALVWNAATNRWEPQAVSGAASSGISMLSQAGDFVVARLNSTTLSIGANCSLSTPCNVRFGSTVYSIISGATASLTAGTGVAYVFVSSSGIVTVGHSLTLSCPSGCTAQSGVTSFPADSIPLYTWSATNGAWDLNGGSDQRAFADAKVVQPGIGLASTEVSGKTIISVDATVIGIRASVPATSSAPCTAGSWAMDTSYYYICVSSSAWRRAALSSW